MSGIENEIEYGDTLTPSMYARLKNVKPSRITVLREKLETKKFFHQWLVVHCKKNDKLFPNANK